MGGYLSTAKTEDISGSNSNKSTILDNTDISNTVLTDIKEITGIADVAEIGTDNNNINDDANNNHTNNDNDKNPDINTSNTIDETAIPKLEDTSVKEIIVAESSIVEDADCKIQSDIPSEVKTEEKSETQSSNKQASSNIKKRKKNKHH